MATTEEKTESKPEVEENKENPLNYKAWVLKVSIHCEACKRKVEKKLRKIEGVYEAYADLKQQKATVKSNLHVNAETLIKKLVKKGKHAELWPEKSEPKEKKQGKSKSKDKQVVQREEANDDSNHVGGDKEKETVKNEGSVEQDGGAKSSENGGSGKVAEGKQNVTHDQGGKVKESKPEVKENVTLSAGNQSPVPEKKVSCGESEGNAAEKSGSGSGNGSKKNKKKGQKANVGEGEHHDPHGPVPMTSPANHNLPRQHPMYEYPTYHHSPPVYLTSYNTVYPSSSNSGSYYTSPPPYSYSYSYIHSRTSDHLPLNTYSSYPPYSSQPTDSFEMFSDENPNACSIM